MKKFPFLHLLLFIFTVFSTLFAGALQAGVNLINEPEKIYKGLPFSLTLIVILLSHELSHYFASKKHGVKATLPYFIPFTNIIGTLGAFIKMKSPIITRKALIDIGASGPIVGFIISVIISIVGLSLSGVVGMRETEGTLGLGDSLLFSFLSRIILDYQPGQDVLLHPVAFAGWIGLFVTSINLMPVGQLDGGHITFALGGENVHKRTSIIVFIVLLSLGLTKFFLNGDLLPVSIDIRAYADKYLWEGWALWAVILSFLGLRHPPILYWEVPLDPVRRIIGWITYTVFIITFIPVPFKFL